MSGLGTKAIVADFPLDTFARVVDIGGAHGSVLAAMLAANAQLTGVLFDQPEVCTQIFYLEIC